MQNRQVFRPKVHAELRDQTATATPRAARLRAALPQPRHSSALNIRRRDHELATLADPGSHIDLLVIGGGVTGVGVALDAASRGLSVALVEAHDLAFGTSRWSSKLVHGGLRYLASGDVRVAYESARERHLLMTRLAPHLTRPLPQLTPHLPVISTRQRSMMQVGFMLGDGLRRIAGTPARVLPRPRHISRHEALLLAPALAREGLRGGHLAYDGELSDDARLVVALARTAAAYGVSLLTRVRALAAWGDGAKLRDEVSGEEFAIRAKAVVNATGVWAAAFDPEISLRPSRGTHLVLDAERLGHPRAAIMVPHPGSISRFVFAIPKGDGRVLLGLSDEEAEGEIPDVPQPSNAEIDMLLDIFSRVLERPLSRADVLGSFAGLRPLVDIETFVRLSGSGSIGHRTNTHKRGRSSSGVRSHTADLSRQHLIAAGSTGIIHVLGGKLTTYRRMAEEAVDLVCMRSGLGARSCVTSRLPLIGAPGSPVSPAEPPLADDPAQVEQVVPDIPLTRAAVMRAVWCEGAMNVDDVLDRRSRIGLVPADRERSAAAVSALVDEALSTAPPATDSEHL